MKVSNNLQQGTAEWFEARKGRVTGSVAGAILGLSPFMSRDDAMRSMVREYFKADREFVGNIATDYGNDNEDKAIAAYELDTGNLVISTGFHTFDDWIGASPDGLVDTDKVIEVKCPFGKRNAASSSEFKTSKDQPHYYAQMQLEMLCTHRSTCDFWQWSEGASLLEVIERNDEWIGENLPKLRAFYDEYLSVINDESLYQPHLEDAHVDMSGDDQWQLAEQAYLDAKAQADEATTHLNDCKKFLIDLANGRKCTSDNLTVFKTERKGSISYAKAFKENNIEIDLEPYRGKGSTSWTVKGK